MNNRRSCPPCDGLCNSGRLCPARRFGEPISWAWLLAVIVVVALFSWDALLERCATVWRRVRPNSRYEWIALGALLSWTACVIYIAVILGLA